MRKRPKEMQYFSCIPQKAQLRGKIGLKKKKVYSSSVSPVL